MHILIAAVSSARNPSGICRHAANLAKSLAEAPGISRVTLLLGSWQVSYFQHAFGLRGAKLHVATVDVRNNSWARNLWYYRTLPRLAEEHAADVVHLSFPVPVSRQRFHRPLLVSLHDLYPYDIPANFGTARVLFNRVFLQQCLNESDAVVCSSDFTRERLRSVRPAASQKATTIHQGVAIDPRRSRMPSIPEISGRQFLLAVGQHRRNKNLGLLLLAVAELRRRDQASRRMRLLIVGAEGPETRALHSVIKQHSIQDQVIFQKALSDDELCWLYRRCALLIAPSSIEGFGLPVAEALHCGSRVLCSDIPVFREIGGVQCSYFSLTQNKQVDTLVDAIQSALDGTGSQDSVSNRFSPSEIAQQHVTLYSRLMSGDPSLLPQADSVRHAEYAS
jgi:glycosyltransferase involved in cell wall biosynthesis